MADNGVQNGGLLTNPLNPSETLKRPLDSEQEVAHPPQPPFEQDSAVTKAEKVERHGFDHISPVDATPAAKRAKTEADENSRTLEAPDRKRGSAPVKVEYESLSR